jgi:hypothetical protein
MNAFTTGITAGAAGTTMLNAVTYLDMAIRGRPASTVPDETVESVASALGVAIPGRGEALAARRSAFGALGGIAVGIGIGAGASLVRRVGAHLTPTAGTIGVGLAAMAATDIPLALRGISNPRTWTTPIGSATSCRTWSTAPPSPPSCDNWTRPRTIAPLDRRSGRAPSGRP